MMKTIYALVGLKLLLHLGTNTNYGFHRDEYLYLVEGQHLAWGFMEIPPFTAFIAWLANAMGSSVFVVRLFPALVGALTVYLLCRLVKSFGGKQWAIIIVGLAFILSPAMLRGNTLFQPVSFNQFFWFLTAYFFVQLIQKQKKRYWYAIGAAIGIGFLTKHSIVFYAIGLGLAFLFSRHRHWMRTKHPYLAILLVLLIAAPNIYWQYLHNFPVFQHMQELQETQLGNVHLLDFIKDQFLMNGLSSLIWIAGLVALFFDQRWKAYRMVATAGGITICLIGFLSGKSYYTLGAYTILFVFGALFLEAKIHSTNAKRLLVAGMVLFILPILPYGLPILPAAKMKTYCAWMSENLNFKSQLRWEDGEYYDLPQDYADMHGWEELVQKVARFYHQLKPEEQQRCNIYGGSYGHASALNFYRKKYDLPETYSVTSSFVIWADEDLVFDRQILVDDVQQDSSSWFANMTLVDQLNHPDAREPGYIYYRTEPRGDMRETWRNYVTEEKARFNF